MNRIITTTVYTLNELSSTAQEKARDGYRQHHADSNWYENVYEDFREVCGIFGIDLRQRVFRLSNGRFMEEPSIWFSGFCSQGDGACFEGRWHWQPATVRRIRKYAPQEHELHRIADALQAVQKRNFWQLQAEIHHRGRYCHPYSMDNCERRGWRECSCYILITACCMWVFYRRNFLQQATSLISAIL
ncbi:hypothetical protein, partial [Escherichia coli]|uniref:hypothetical protein n=1 Tax=Escherichia coli TaxID=562 RepID=UPI00201B13C0